MVKTCYHFFLININTFLKDNHFHTNTIFHLLSTLIYTCIEIHPHVSLYTLSRVNIVIDINLFFKEMFQF